MERRSKMSNLCVTTLMGRAMYCWWPAWYSLWWKAILRLQWKRECISHSSFPLANHKSYDPSNTNERLGKTGLSGNFPVLPLKSFNLLYCQCYKRTDLIHFCIEIVMTKIDRCWPTGRRVNRNCHCVCSQDAFLLIHFWGFLLPVPYVGSK